MTRTVTQPENEFGSLAETVASVGLDPHEIPPVQRKWVNISAGGHISGVVWRTGPPQLVLLHRPDTQARDLDRIALLLPVPLVVIDLPGSGRSSGPALVPRRAARDIAEAVQSFAPRAAVIAGIGESALTALLVTGRVPALTTATLIDAEAGDALTEQLATTTTTVEQLATDGEPATSGAPGVAAALLDAVHRI